jgi:copper transport protein
MWYRSRSRRTRRVSIAAITAALALAVVPAAAAHAVLIGTEPGNDATVQESPSRVLLRFNEPVETALGSLAVYDGRGERVDAGAISQPTRREVVVAVDEELARGTYTVAWRVVSADSDPISGAFVFHVQAPGSHPRGVAEEVVAETPLLVDVLFTGGRFFEFLFLLLCAGGVAALVYALRSADERVHRRLYGLLAACAGALAFFALLGIPLQGAAARASGLGDAFRPNAVADVLGTRYGKVEVLRFLLALGLAGAALYLRRSAGRARETGNAAAAALAVGLVLTPPFAGHAITAGTVAIVADVAHVLAAAAWVGGLGFVVVALWLALEERWPLATRSVPRFSTMAVVAVVLLLVAGTINGYLQIRSWRGLWETQYGLLLLAKIALVVPLLGLGAFNNRFVVPRLRAGVAQPRERRRFMRTAGVELAVMVSIIAVTAVLVNESPARSEMEMEHAAAEELHGAGGSAVPHGGPASEPVDFGQFGAVLAVEPGRAGPNTIRLELDHADPDFPELDEVTFSASLPDREIGPLQFEARQPEHGVWRVANADLAIPGAWEVRVEARRGEFDLFTDIVSVPIGEAAP